VAEYFEEVVRLSGGEADESATWVTGERSRYSSGFSSGVPRYFSMSSVR